MKEADLSVVHVVREVHPYGGVSGVVYALDEAMRRMGVQSRILSRRPRAAQASRAKAKFPLLIDVVSFTFSASIAAMKIRRDRNVVTIVHNEGLIGDIYVDHGLHKAVVAQRPQILLRNPLHLFIFVREELRHRFGLYRRIVFLSQFSLRQFQRYFPAAGDVPHTIIPNGVDLNRFDFAGRSPEDAQRLRLIFVGHEYERKGLAWILKALVHLDANVTLTVVGGSDGEIAQARQSAQALRVDDRVEFLGKRSDVNILFLKQDVLVFPSAFESWGLVVLEAMACGVPVITTPVGCAEEVIVEGQTGYLVREDENDIAAKIRQVQQQRDRLPAMRLAARRMAERYSWSNIAQQYLEVARQVKVEKRRERPASGSPASA